MKRVHIKTKISDDLKPFLCFPRTMEFKLKTNTQTIGDVFEVEEWECSRGFEKMSFFFRTHFLLFGSWETCLLLFGKWPLCHAFSVALGVLSGQLDPQELLGSIIVMKRIVGFFLFVFFLSNKLTERMPCLWIREPQLLCGYKFT